MAENGPLRILSNNRVTFVGKTGSGKTFLAKRYLSALPHVLVVDLKQDFDPRSIGAKGVVETLGQVRKLAGGRYVYRPVWKYRTPEAWNAFFWLEFERRNHVLYLDEVKNIVGDPPISPDGLNACLQMGRSRGLGVWSATQRPVRVPRNIISEAEHFFCFQLGNPTDREFMAEVMETPEVGSRIRDPHGFWYYSVDGMDRARYFKQLRS